MVFFLAEKYGVFEAENVSVFFVSTPPWGWGGPPPILRYKTILVIFLRYKAKK